MDSETVYEALITGCALSGPAGCAAASEGDGPLDIDAKVQGLLNAAYNATNAHNGSASLTSGQIRREYQSILRCRLGIATMCLVMSQMLMRSFETVSVWQTLYEAPIWVNWTNDYYPQAVQIVQGESGKNISLERNSSHIPRL